MVVCSTWNIRFYQFFFFYRFAINCFINYFMNVV